MSELPIPAELMPRHVAVIMDGNGRWAKKRGMPRAFGHRAGVEALEPTIEACGGWGIEALTLFAFSTENWARPKDEVAALMGLIVEYFNKKIDKLDRKGVCIRMLGDLSAVPDLQRETALRAMERTKANEGLQLNIALNYGGRAELLRAARALAEQVRSGALDPADIDEAKFDAELYTAGQPPVDLLIRTSGEQRLSNFMLWQLAYTEFVFTDCHWPDFTNQVYWQCLCEYMARDRRFGAIGGK